MTFVYAAEARRCSSGLSFFQYASGVLRLRLQFRHRIKLLCQLRQQRLAAAARQSSTAHLETQTAVIHVLTLV